MRISDYLHVTSALIIVVSVVYYLLAAWNKTTLPIHLLHLRDIYTIQEWRIHVNMNYGRAVGKWLTCPTCQIPGVSLFIAGPVGTIMQLSSMQALWVWLVSWGLILALSDDSVPAEATAIPPLQLLDPQKGKLDQRREEIQAAISAAPPQQLVSRSSSSPAQQPLTGDVGIDRYNEYTRVFQIPRNADGSVTMTANSITADLRAVLPFFTDSPCWFSNCELLRQQFQEEKAAAIRDPNCHSCSANDIQRKFSLIVRAELDGEGLLPSTKCPASKSQG